MSSFNPVGPQGKAGPQGPSGQVHVSSTQTGDEGTEASVVNVGTATNAQLVFTIPRGDTGEVGPVGPVGPKGDPGDIADRAATVVPGSTVALTITGGDIELQIPSWINSMSVAEEATTSAASPSPSTLVVQDASISWTDIGGFGTGVDLPSIQLTAYPFAANAVPAYANIAWYAEQFSASYYGESIKNVGGSMAPSFQRLWTGYLSAPTQGTITETKMTGTVRQGGSFALKWGNVTVASTGPSSGDCNMSGGNQTASGGGISVLGTPTTASHTQAGVYRTYTATRTVSIPALSVPVGLPDGTYTGTVSGYAFAQLPQWLVLVNVAQWRSYKSGFLTYYYQDNIVFGAPSDFLGPIVTTVVPWSASGSFNVSSGSVQIPARSVTITQNCPCYARIGPSLYKNTGGTPQADTSQQTLEQLWNGWVGNVNRYAIITERGASTTVPLKKGYFVSTISLSR